MGSISTRTTAAIALAATATLASSNVFAVKCGDVYQHPSGSDYFDIQTTLLDDATLKKVRSFTRDLDGRWEGNGLEVKCGISDDQPLSTISNYDVDAEVNQHFLGALVLEVEQETKRAVNLDRITISPETERDDQGQRTGHRN